VTLHVHTARISFRGWDRLDVTRKSGDEIGKSFAPSWHLLRPFLALRKRNGVHTDAEWADYAARYTAEMRVSYVERRMAWDAVLAQSSVTLVCYCVNATQCHRRLLANILVKLGAVDLGEVVASS
jgi:uncharacterized protein YeaO (DUF488 family)